MGNIEIYKVYLIIKKFYKKEDIDHKETFYFILNLLFSYYMLMTSYYHHTIYYCKTVILQFIMYA